MIRTKPVRARHRVSWRNTILPAVLALSALGVANAASVTPKRSLAPEAAEVSSGTAAYVHTDYSAGAGMLLPDETEVLVARHLVLAPDGSVAAQIGVGLPRLPLNNIVEVPTTVEAQDPSLDLVLLRIADTAKPSAASPSSGGPADGKVAVSIKATRGNRPVKRRRAIIRRAAARRRHPGEAVQAPVVEARLRIVVDGPRAR